MRELSQEFFLSDKYLNLDKFYLNNFCVNCGVHYFTDEYTISSLILVNLIQSHHVLSSCFYPFICHVSKAFVYLQYFRCVFIISIHIDFYHFFALHTQTFIIIFINQDEILSTRKNARYTHQLGRII